MGMRTVYVVMGQTGEYSDRSEWPVAAYLRREDADAHENAAMLRSHELGPEWRRLAVKDRPANEYDPGMRMDYTGTDYYVMEVPLCEAFAAQPSNVEPSPAK